jgi:hypothetical protein
MTVVNCCHKFEFNSNEIDDGEDATELSIHKDVWGQLEAGVQHEECVS